MIKIRNEKESDYKAVEKLRGRPFIISMFRGV